MNIMFNKAFDVILRLEGGFVNNPSDPGGETKYGISKREYPNLNISALTLEDAKEIYLRDYWNKCQCDKMQYRLALYVFDCSINQGVATAIKMLQVHLHIPDDGIIGEQTLKAMLKANIWEDYEYLSLRTLHYAKTQNWDTFKLGWMNRLFKLAIGN